MDDKVALKDVVDELIKQRRAINRRVPWGRILASSSIGFGTTAGLGYVSKKYLDRKYPLSNSHKKVMSRYNRNVPELIALNRAGKSNSPRARRLASQVNADYGQLRYNKRNIPALLAGLGSLVGGAGAGVGAYHLFRKVIK